MDKENKAEKQTQTQTLKPRRVLLADPDQETRRQIKAEFERDDKYTFLFTEASDFSQALQILDQGDKFFDLLIFDSEASLDVESFLIAAKRSYPKTRIVFTVCGVPETVRFMHAGAHHVIPKNIPAPLDALHKTARAYLDQGQPDNNEPSEEWLKEKNRYLADKYDGQLVAFIDGRDVDNDSDGKRLRLRVYGKYGEAPYILKAPVKGLQLTKEEIEELLPGLLSLNK